MLPEREVRERALAHGQEQVFRCWTELDAAGRERLLDQLAGIDFALVDRLGALLREPPTAACKASSCDCAVSDQV